MFREDWIEELTAKLSLKGFKQQGEKCYFELHHDEMRGGKMVGITTIASNIANKSKLLPTLRVAL
jgi:hypothetical protein